MTLPSSSSIVNPVMMSGGGSIIGKTVETSFSGVFDALGFDLSDVFKTAGWTERGEQDTKQVHEMTTSRKKIAARTSSTSDNSAAETCLACA